jgi:hypothetical protein
MAPNYTTFANSSVMLGQALMKKMAHFPLGESKRLLTVQPPAGPSTSGGTQSRQALMMEGGNEHPVCGFVDFVNAEAEVKDFVSARQAFELRYHHPFDVSEAEYVAWTAHLQASLLEFKLNRFQVTTDEPLGANVPQEANAAAKEPPWKLMFMVTAGAVLLGAALWLVFR